MVRRGGAESTPREQSITEHELIAQPDRRTAKWLALLPLATLGLQSTIFLGMNSARIPPIDWWALSFVCLVPWIIFTVTVSRRRVAYSASYMLGVSFYLLNTSYIRHITFAGYIAMGVYFGLFYLLFSLALRPAWLRWNLPLTVLVPVLWVASEFGRGIGPLALPFLFLSHGVYRHLALIQISDVLGSYGVSFVVAMVNGFVADCVIHRFRLGTARAGRPSLVGPFLATLLVTAASVVYGIVQLNRHTMSPGPKIAVLQGDYPLTVEPGGSGATELDKARTYFDLLEQAAVHEPDLILLPETPWYMYLNEEFLEASTFPVRLADYEELQRASRLFDEEFHRAADTHDAYVVVGAGAIEFPGTHYPSALKYNSAFVYAPHLEKKARYDKVVLVMFGEYTPFRYGRLHALYRWLDSFNPFSMPDDEFSLTAGEEFSVFEMVDSQGQAYHFGIPICFEDLIPKVSRRFTSGPAQRVVPAPPGGRKSADFLLSISNDGWFNHGSMVPQHLAVCVFRAVENRVGIARAVNTACSGFVDPDGRIHHLVNQAGRVLGPGIFGFEVARVKIDSRRSWYSLLGDWFGVLCAVIGGGVLVAARFFRTGSTN